MTRIIDLIVAVRNEEESIPDFIDAVSRIKNSEFSINIIFIEDYSTDGTLELLRKLSKNSNLINYYSIENKYGQSAALTYGLIKSNSEASITLDVDGGHPVWLIVDIINLYIKGNDVVQGVRVTFEKRKLYRTFGSKVFNIMFWVITGVDINNQNVAYRLMSKKAKDIFLSKKRWWYFFRTNFCENDSINTDYFKFNTEERTKGQSKFNFRRLLSAAIKSPLSIISIRRYILINVISLLLSLYLIISGYYLPGIAISLVLAYLFYHFTGIYNFDFNKRIKVNSTSTTKEILR